jgi:A/G-specific adenine glycosylase
MYEFPNELGYMDIKSVVSYVKEQGLKPLYVEPVLDSKHVFSHVEWHMKGYLVRVEPVDGVDMGRVFAEVLDLKERYAVPAAFAAYMQYLDIWPKKG